MVCGVCVEIDHDYLIKLKELEKGYDIKKVSIKLDGRKETKFVTYISCSVDATLVPSSEYKALMLKGASHLDLSKTYIAVDLAKKTKRVYFGNGLEPVT